MKFIKQIAQRLNPDLHIPGTDSPPPSITDTKSEEFIDTSGDRATEGTFHAAFQLISKEESKFHVPGPRK